MGLTLVYFSVLPAYAGMIWYSKVCLEYFGFLGFYKGNIIKYILRANKKNGLEDYKKVRQYLDWYIQELESDQVTDGQMTYMEDEMERELTQEEDEEYLYLIKKSISTVLRMSKKDWERFDELFAKKHGTLEEQQEEIRQNRKRFYKFQESLGKKLKNS